MLKTPRPHNNYYNFLFKKLMEDFSMIDGAIVQTQLSSLNVLEEPKPINPMKQIRRVSSIESKSIVDQIFQQKNIDLPIIVFKSLKQQEDFLVNIDIEELSNKLKFNNIVLYVYAELSDMVLSIPMALFMRQIEEYGYCISRRNNSLNLYELTNLEKSKRVFKTCIFSNQGFPDIFDDVKKSTHVNL